MNKLKFIPLAAGLVLAMAFTFSCSSDGGDDDGGGSSSSGGSQGGVSSSSGGGGSSSSVVQCLDVDNGNFIDSRDGKEYKYVTICSQIWMAENLNYDPGTGNSACYDNQASNCATYGRLYDWSTAMGFESSCNFNSCSSQIQSKHRGVCPSGWHLPSGVEWSTLMNYVGSPAGTKLKATSGWDYDANGTDEFGFSALPGGHYESAVLGSGLKDGYFEFVGSWGDWWGASESLFESSSYDAYSCYMTSITSGASCAPIGDKINLYSVRCVQDYGGGGGGGSSSSIGGGGNSSSSSSNGGGGGYTGSYGSVSHGGKTYKTVVIGTQTWMAENLNYDPGTGNSTCYYNNPSNCDTYGRLYDWSTAMGFESRCNENLCSSQIQAKHKGVCPSGWHLPRDAEWDVLITAVGGSSTAGTKLRATSGWNSYNGASGNGTDDYGFSALPGGLGNSGGLFSLVGHGGNWWSATESCGGYVYCDGAYYRDMNYHHSYMERDYYNKSYLFSVRCVQD